jgi:hypothetical protein
VRALRIALTLVAVLVTIGCALNVFSDDAAVRAAAEAIACPHGCAKASSMRVDRSVIAETVEYEMPGGIVRVRCARAGILVGPYSCAKD